MNNSKVYYSLSVCPEHGDVRGKIRIRKADNGRYYAVKTLKAADTEEAEEIRMKREALRRKRQLKRKLEKEV